MTRAPLHALRALTQVSDDATRDRAIRTYADALAAQDAPQRTAARRLAIATLVEQMVADDDEHAAAMVDRALAHAVEARASEWPDPIPLRDAAELPAFPAHALPEWLRAWVLAETVATQTPTDMPGMLALGALAAAAARRYVIRVRAEWREPLCIFVAVSQPPAARKSAVERAATEPIVAWEADAAECMATEILTSRSMRAAAEQRLDEVTRQASKLDGADRLAAQQEIGEAAAEVEGTRVVVAPRVVCGDVTQEQLAVLLDAHGGTMALFDAEGCGPIALMLGRYTSGAAALEIFLKGHAGDTINVDRIGRPRITVRAPALTVAVCVQPEVLRQLGQRPEVRGLGLLARFAWVVPEPTVGRREIEPPPMPEYVRDTYAQRLRAVLDAPATPDGQRREIRVSPEGWAVLRDFSAEIEPQLGPGGDLESVADWAGKLIGLTARIAGLIHVAEHSEDSEYSVRTGVGAGAMAGAVQIGRYLLAHARAAITSMGADPVIGQAEHVLDWLRAHRVARSTRRDLHQALRGRFTRPTDMDPALDVLTERGWIRVSQQERPGAGRKPSPTIEAHPRLLTPTRNPHNPHNGPTTPGVDL